jgi:nucleotide-binding universal stress UspA family protein
MTIAKILVPIRGDGKGEAVLDHAIALGRGFNAHVEALYCRAAAEDMLPYGVVVPRMLRDQIRQSMKSVASGESEHLRGLFDGVAQRHGLEVVGNGTVPPRDRPTLGWATAEGRQADLLGVHGRLTDLIAVPRPDHEANLGFNTLYAALMNTGRPVLMCPPRAPETALPGHIAIAWNGSTEAARAVALGTDLLQEASAVTILTSGKLPKGASAEELVGYLAVRGITATHAALPPGGDVGQTILDGATARGADMLLMGAYSHSRGRESLFGGVSQHIVDHADLPVVLVH